jgi:hypothetical protein
VLVATDRRYARRPNVTAAGNAIRLDNHLVNRFKRLRASQLLRGLFHQRGQTVAKIGARVWPARRLCRLLWWDLYGFCYGFSNGLYSRNKLASK